MSNMFIMKRVSVDIMEDLRQSSSHFICELHVNYDELEAARLCFDMTTLILVLLKTTVTKNFVTRKYIQHNTNNGFEMSQTFDTYTWRII